MTTVFDTAKYILEKKGPMSTMKLQKLCYYAQAWSLVWTEEPLFQEEFQAWANGPVCRELFNETKGRYQVSAADEPKGDSSRLTDDQKDICNRVIDFYGDRSAQYLSTLSHQEDPWKNAREGIAPGYGSDNIITKDSMAFYYGGL